MIDKLQYATHSGMLTLYLFFAWEVLCAKHRYNNDISVRLRQLCAVLYLVLAVSSGIWLYINAFEGEIAGFSITSEVFLDLTCVPLCVMIFMEVMRAQTITLPLFFSHMAVPVALVLANFSFKFDGLIYSGYTYYTIYILYFVNKCRLSYKRYNHDLQNIYSDLEGRLVDWVVRLAIMLSIVFVLYLLLDIYLRNPYTMFAYCISSMLIWTNLWSNISHMRNNNLVADTDELTTTDEILMQILEEKKGSAQLVNANSSAKVAPILVVNDDEKEVFAAKLKVIEAEKLYRNPDFNRDDAIRAVGLNRSTFTLNLKETTGMSFSAYIRHIRVEHACQLLEQTNYTVESIAYETGFNSVQNFYRVFKIVKGITPTEYRQQIEPVDNNRTHCE